MISFAKVSLAMTAVRAVCVSTSHFSGLDDVFVASTSVSDLPPTDLQEINIEMLNESHSTSRGPVPDRSPMKFSDQSPPDHDTPNARTGAAAAGVMHLDFKKMASVRDSGFLDDEDGLSSRGSELTTSRKTPSKPWNISTKQTETVSEDTPTPNDLIGRRLKSENDVLGVDWKLYNNVVFYL
jgi:hypothetical protein